MSISVGYIDTSGQDQSSLLETTTDITTTTTTTSSIEDNGSNKYFNTTSPTTSRVVRRLDQPFQIHHHEELTLESLSLDNNNNQYNNQNQYNQQQQTIYSTTTIRDSNQTDNTPNTSFIGASYVYDDELDEDDDLDDDSLEDMYMMGGRGGDDLDETDLQNIDQYFDNNTQESVTSDSFRRTNLININIRASRDDINLTNNNNNNQSTNNNQNQNNQSNNNVINNNNNNINICTTNNIDEKSSNSTSYNKELSMSDMDGFYQQYLPTQKSFQIFTNYQQPPPQQQQQLNIQIPITTTTSSAMTSPTTTVQPLSPISNQNQGNNILWFDSPNIGYFNNSSSNIELDLSESGLDEFPEIELDNEFKIIDLSHNAISSIDVDDLEAVKDRLEQLILFNNVLVELAPRVAILRQLTILDLSHNHLTVVCPEIAQLTKLRELYLSGNSLSMLPYAPSSLRKLLLDNNQIETIDEAHLVRLTQLQTLDLSINRISSVPSGGLSKLTNLKVFHLSKNVLTEIPLSMRHLTKLHSLSLDHNQITDVGEKTWIKLTRLAKLTLAANRIKSLPYTINQLSSLIELNVSQNQLESLPDSICFLSNIKKLDLNNNNIKELPNDIGYLTKLVDFQLYNNHISHFPKSFLKCRSIRDVGVDGNPLPSFYHLGIKAIRYHIKNPDCDEIDQSMIIQEDLSSSTGVMNHSSNPRRNIEFDNSNNNNYINNGIMSSPTKNLYVNVSPLTSSNISMTSSTASLSSSGTHSLASSITSSGQLSFSFATPSPKINQSFNTSVNGVNGGNGGGPNFSMIRSGSSNNLNLSNHGNMLLGTKSNSSGSGGNGGNSDRASLHGSSGLGGSFDTKVISPPRTIRYEWEIDYKELEIGDLIGQGGFSRVYHGRWRGKEVAIKQIELQSYKSLEDFRREVGILSKLRPHENLLHYYGACTQSQYCYIITEFLPRGSLFDLLHRDRLVKVDDNLLLTFATGIALGCYHLSIYDPPIYHTDLKSKNLLVTNSLKIKICDFGLASCKRKDNKVDDGRLAYAFYAAPEILNCRPFTEKSDVFSFGTILWELVSKKIPFDGMDPHYVKDLLKSGERLDIPVDCPEVYKTLIQDCWKHSSEDRPTFLDIYYRLEQQRQSLFK